MAALELDLRPREDGAGWRAYWLCDGEAPGPPVDYDDPAGDGLNGLESSFRQLFEQDGRPLVAPEALRNVGRLLFDGFFSSLWTVLKGRLGGGRHSLLVRSAEPRLLNLPWELVELSPGLPVGCDAAWALRRTPLAELTPLAGTLAGGPLRLLFLAAAPRDQAQLDYEAEEDAMLRAIGRLKRQVHLQIGEAGTFEEMGVLVAEMRPHVVHMSGHGALLPDGRGAFAFEDERGRTDLVTAERMAAEVFRGSSVRCAFFNGCETSQAAAAGLCQSLVTAGLPLALGWAAPVADDLATLFAERFYQRVVRAEPLPAAAAHAREAIRRKGLHRSAQGEVQDATFALPQLYCAEPRDGLFDPHAPAETYAGPRVERRHLGDGVVGLVEGMVGRRRQIQELVPSLRSGEVTFAVLTAIGGAGKSTLATRAANRLEGDGFFLIPVRAATEGASSATRAALTLSSWSERSTGRAYAQGARTCTAC